MNMSSLAAVSNRTKNFMPNNIYKIMNINSLGYIKYFLVNCWHNRSIISFFGIHFFLYSLTSRFTQIKTLLRKEIYRQTRNECHRCEFTMVLRACTSNSGKNQNAFERELLSVCHNRKITCLLPAKWKIVLLACKQIN